MANEDADSRPISVSELLARRQAAGGPTPAAQGRGRRRVGRDGAVSMSELTGEIPKITDDPTPPAAAAPSVPPVAPTPTPATPTPPAAPTPVSTPTPPPVSPPAPPPASDPRVSAYTQPTPSSFPRSENPAARQPTPGSASGPSTGPTAVPRFTTASGMPGYTPAPPTLPEPIVAEDTADTSAGASTDTAAASTTPEVPVGDIPVAERVAPAVSATDQTTVIPAVDSTPPSSAGFAEVMDDFDSYRNFSDVEDEPVADVKPKRRLFGRRKKADAPTRAAIAKAAAPETVVEPALPTTPEPASDQAPSDDLVWAPATTESTIVTNEPTADELLDVEPADSEPIAVGYTAEPGRAAEPAAPDEVETALLEIDDSATATPGTSTAEAPDSFAADSVAADSVTGNGIDDAAEPAVESAEPADAPSAPALAYSELPEGESYAAAMPLAAANGPGIEPAETTESADSTDDAADSAARRRARAALRDDPAAVAALDAKGLDAKGLDGKGRDAAAGKDEAKKDKKAAKAAKKQAAARAADGDAPAEHTEHSPITAWALLILEVLAGIAIGIGLFWGFTELWRWNVWFALVLAVLVIFGIVTFAHVVRHARDLFTTLLALGVGLIVTMGPLVLLT